MTTIDNALINRLVPFVHVADVEASLAFYALLGFRSDEVMRDDAGRAAWAWASACSKTPGAMGADIMFSLACEPIDPTVQAVIFYMYSRDVASLRRHLLAQGLHDGGPFCGLPGPKDGLRCVFNVDHPEHMPAGELRISDPDGYCILVGQLEP